MQWLNDVFGVPKPIIAMLHLGALPGDPAYDTASGMRKIVDDARRDLDALQTGGVDAVLISNEFSLPYLTKTEPITAITMARVIGELLDEITVPFGANVLWDGVASIDLAAATGAAFVRRSSPVSTPATSVCGTPMSGTRLGTAAEWTPVMCGCCSMLFRRRLPMSRSVIWPRSPARPCSTPSLTRWWFPG